MLQYIYTMLSHLYTSLRKNEVFFLIVRKVKCDNLVMRLDKKDKHVTE